MLNKSFDDLSTKEKFRLQAIEKKVARNSRLTDEEQQLYDRFHERYAKELQNVKAKWPIIILLFIVFLIVIFNRHFS
ncbi:MAG: hypothetical protein ACR2RB_11685 [Gammaproteobacteria bacterium]